METTESKKKRKSVNSLIIVITGLIFVTAFYINKSGETGELKDFTSKQPKEFVNIIFNSKWFGALDRDPNPEFLAIDNNISSYRDSLFFSGIHIYGFDAVTSGRFDEPSVNYINGINNQISRIESAGLRGFYGRIKIETPSYAQRLVYEAEGGNDGFSYQRIMGQNVNSRPDIIIEDLGRTVVHLKKGQAPGFLCENIYENLQHGDFFDFTQRDAGYWYFRPVMRIPADNFNPSDDTPVISIVTRNFKGDYIDTIIIRKRHFPADYKGQYIMDYPSLGRNFIQGHPDSLKSINRGITANWDKWDTECKVDFKIYWHGQVDVWFDKLIVDDESGNELFAKSTFRERIRDEIISIKFDYDRSRLNLDELTYSQLPAFKYVTEIVREINPEIKFNIAQSYYLHQRSLKNDTLGIRKFLEVSQPASFNKDIHSIPWVLPNSINGGFNGNNLVSKEDYTNELQHNSFGHKNSGWTFIKQVSFARKQRDALITCSPQLIIQPQIHGWMFRDTKDTSKYRQTLREPLNEEIQAQAMLAIAHGAEGLCWFVYQSEYIEENFPGEGKRITHSFGLTDPYDVTKHRHKNLYNQDKWQYVSDMNRKIKNWTEVLNNSDWLGGYSVHQEGANHEFISDVKSIYRNISYPFNFSENNLDNSSNRFWEMGFFTPNDNTSGSKYFLMVNRRCVPEAKEGTGDIRWLKIRFNASLLSGYSKWKIEDVNTGQFLIFDIKDTSGDGYLDLGNQKGAMGYFLPGEGKLFRLSQVI